jgi:hypothetical protein
LSSNFPLWIRIRIGYGFKNFVEPDWGKMLDPDPEWIYPDPQPCCKEPDIRPIWSYQHTGTYRYCIKSGVNKFSFSLFFGDKKCYVLCLKNYILIIFFSSYFSTVPVPGTCTNLMMLLTKSITNRMFSIIQCSTVYTNLTHSGIYSMFDLIHQMEFQVCRNVQTWRHDAVLLSE